MTGMLGYYDFADDLQKYSHSFQTKNATSARESYQDLAERLPLDCIADDSFGRVVIHGEIAREGDVGLCSDFASGSEQQKWRVAHVTFENDNDFSGFVMLTGEGVWWCGVNWERFWRGTGYFDLFDHRERDYQQGRFVSRGQTRIQIHINCCSGLGDSTLL